MKTITISCPDSICAQLDAFVEKGWAKDRDGAVIDALRRFLESHRPDLIRSQIQADVKWGLRGDD
jgi:metal-responsive CopG/Arc/MetJ family transcriptional regulator